MTGHVSRLGFGRDRDLFQSLAKYLEDLKKQGSLTEWEIPYFRRQFYDQMYGVTDKCYYLNKEGNKAVKNFNDFTAPLRMVSMNVKEGLTESEMYRRKAWEYRQYKIGEVQGMTFKEWMSLPPHLMETILSDIRKEGAAVLSAVNETKKAVNKMIPDGAVSPEQLAMYAGSKAL